jgi:hypothetical protein
VLDRAATGDAGWMYHARTEQFAVVQDGLLRSLRLTHTGAQTFFTLPELMAANLRAAGGLGRPVLLHRSGVSGHDG